MTVKMIAPIDSGNQPPSKSLIRFAPKNARSKIRKSATSEPAASLDQCQRSRATA